MSKIAFQKIWLISSCYFLDIWQKSKGHKSKNIAKTIISFSGMLSDCQLGNNCKHHANIQY